MLFKVHFIIYSNSFIACCNYNHFKQNKLIHTVYKMILFGTIMHNEYFFILLHHMYTMDGMCHVLFIKILYVYVSNGCWIHHNVCNG